jgi:hypothetical protein
MPISFTCTTPDGKLKVTAPSGWDEITFAQLIRIELEWNKDEKKDVIKLFSILTGIEFEVVEGLTDPHMHDVLYEVCMGIITNDQPNWGAIEPPKRILWKDPGDEEERMITIPRNLRQETLAQKVMMNGVLRGEDNVMTAIPKAVAIYLHPLIRGGKPDQQAMEEVAEQLKERNAKEICSIGLFFFLKQRNLQSNMVQSLLQRSKIQSRKSQESID